MAMLTGIKLKKHLMVQELGSKLMKKAKTKDAMMTKMTNTSD